LVRSACLPPITAHFASSTAHFASSTAGFAPSTACFAPSTAWLASSTAWLAWSRRGLVSSLCLSCLRSASSHACLCFWGSSAWIYACRTSRLHMASHTFRSFGGNKLKPTAAPVSQTIVLGQQRSAWMLVHAASLALKPEVLHKRLLVEGIGYCQTLVEYHGILHTACH